MQCFRRNGDHDATTGSFRDAECHFCMLKGHIIRAYSHKESTKSRAKGSNSHARKCSGNESGSTSLYGFHQITNGFAAYTANVTMNGSPLSMEVNSGSVCSTVNLRTMYKLGIYDLLTSISSKIMLFPDSCFVQHNDQSR